MIEKYKKQYIYYIIVAYQALLQRLVVKELDHNTNLPITNWLVTLSVKKSRPKLTTFWLLTKISADYILDRLFHFRPKFSNPLLLSIVIFGEWQKFRPNFCLSLHIFLSPIGFTWTTWSPILDTFENMSYSIESPSYCWLSNKIAVLPAAIVSPKTREKNWTQNNTVPISFVYQWYQFWTLFSLNFKWFNDTEWTNELTDWQAL